MSQLHEKVMLSFDAVKKVQYTEHFKTSSRSLQSFFKACHRVSEIALEVYSGF